jgi:ABC-type Fe3+/spermidine/putrescine transport system ATPase subunit
MRVELQNVKKTYSDKTVLDVENLILEEVGIIAVLGPNGSGKTTLLRCVAGIDMATSGHIYYNGMKGYMNKDIAYMPQNTYLFDMTVLDNVMMGLKNRGLNPAESRKLALHALDSVGMGGFYKARAKSLSGGEAQRVALARTLVLRKGLVLLDEPASSTDIAGMETVEKYILEVHKKDSSTIVFTTHNPSQALRIADEAVMMQAGRIIEKNKTQSMFNSPQMQETKDFLRSWRI